MRRFMLLMTTEIDFVSDTDDLAQNYEENLAKVVREAAANLSLRAVSGNKVVKVQVSEVKNTVSL